MTEQNLKNLETLATYLSSGKLQANFDMTIYCDPLKHSFDTDCGSVGCAIGHGPHAGIEKWKSETWGMYSVRVFGLRYYSDDWRDCFDPDWATRDNTPEGAAQRIMDVVSKFRK